MSERTMTIPCTRCDEWKQDLEMTGHFVFGCDHSGSSGMCTLRYSAEQQMFGMEALALHNIAAAHSTVVLPDAAGSSWKKAAEAIVNIFETSSVLGDYSAVTLIQHDSGHLTYGRSQTTLGSGNLYILISLYCERNAAVFGAHLKPYLAKLKAKDFALDNDVTLKNLLRAAADDPVMRAVQDEFFDRYYWQPAARQAESENIRSALGTAVVYDSVVHGSWNTLRDRTTKAHGSISSLGEQTWIRRYLETRRAWLEGHSRPDIRKTVYRMDALLGLVKQQAWGLDLPLVVRGKEISSVTLAGIPDGCFAGPVPGSRDLSMQAPLLRGADVRLLQLAISSPAIAIAADGVYGPVTVNAVKSFQKSKGEAPTGAVGKDMVRALAGSTA